VFCACIYLTSRHLILKTLLKAYAFIHSIVVLRPLFFITMTPSGLRSSSLLDIGKDDTLPAAVMASLRSMSVSDSERRSPDASGGAVGPGGALSPLARLVQVPGTNGGVEYLQVLKEAKRTAKRARDAAPGDKALQARYKTAKKRYKEVKATTKVMDERSNERVAGVARPVKPVGALSLDVPPSLSSLEQSCLQEQPLHRHGHSPQYLQLSQQHVSFGLSPRAADLSPRVTAAVLASRHRRVSNTYRSRMPDVSGGSEIGSNVVSKAGFSKAEISKMSPPVSKRGNVGLCVGSESVATTSPGVFVLFRGGAGVSGGVGVSRVASSGKSLPVSGSGKSALNSGKGSKRSSEKGASRNSVPVSAPVLESAPHANSGKITKYQEHVDYASGPTFHEEWHARREEWLSNYSNAGTIRKYRPYVNKFIQFIEQQGNVQKHPKDAITRTLVNQFQQDVKTRATPSNQTMILSATSSFLKHLAEEDVTPKDRSEHIKIPAAPKPKKKKDLTIEQVKKIMDATDDQKTKALLAAAYFAGLRTKETVHLAASKCKTVGGNMTITVTKASAKGKKERDVPIAKTGAKLLKPFIEAAKARGGHQYLFPGRFKDTHIVEKTMWNYIKKPARAAGLEDVASHHFRHAFASHGAQSGVDIATIKDQMGHSSLKTTSKYVHGKKDHASSVSASLDSAFEDKPAVPVAPAQTPITAPSAPQTGRSATQELVQLVEMYKEGLLTKDEFIAAKRNLSILQ